MLSSEFLTAPIAHRGLHDRSQGRIENSRAAVRAAIAAGYGIEIDIQRAACGEAMVFHDARLKRLTGRPGAVRDHTAAELAGFALTDGGGETIPTLPEILALVAGRAALLVEIKDQDGALGDAVGPLEARVAEALSHYDGPLALMSFNPHSVAALARLAPDRARGLTACDFQGPDWPLPDDRRAELAGLRDFDATGAAFVSHHHRDLENPAVSKLRARGAPILAWTIRSPAEETRARRLAANITFEGYAAPHPD